MATVHWASMQSLTWIKANHSILSHALNPNNMPCMANKHTLKGAQHELFTTQYGKMLHNHYRLGEKARKTCPAKAAHMKSLQEL